MGRGGVVITGASAGIGRACALRLASEGFRVFAGVRREEDGERLRADAGGSLTTVALDVTDPDAIAAARDAVEADLAGQRLAGIVNNAGTAVVGPLESVDLDALRRQIEINAIAPVAVAQAFLPRLRRSQGRVVNVSSVGGRIAWPMLGPYHASKYALEALSDSMRRELLPHGVHVATIEPGTIATDIWEKGRSQAARDVERLDPEQRALYGDRVEAQQKLATTMARRGAPPEKVARAVSHALTADRPKVRYVIGDARLLLAVAALLPDRVLDRLMNRLTS